MGHQMKKLVIISSLAISAGCSTIKDYWPRNHDAVLFDRLVVTDIAIERIDCDHPNWTAAQDSAEALARYAEWRADPQVTNLKGLYAHIQRMARGGSRTFCELGKKTARERIEAARSAWQGR